MRAGFGLGWKGQQANGTVQATRKETERNDTKRHGTGRNGIGHSSDKRDDGLGVAGARLLIRLRDTGGH